MITADERAAWRRQHYRIRHYALRNEVQAERCVRCGWGQVPWPCPVIHLLDEIDWLRSVRLVDEVERLEAGLEAECDRLREQNAKLVEAIGRCLSYDMIIGDDDDEVSAYTELLALVANDQEGETNE